VHKLLNAGLPVVGMIVVFGAVLFLEDRRTMILVVLLGILLIEAGVWKLSNPFLPTERRFNALRLEVDQFMELVRELNGSAVEALSGEGNRRAWARFRNTLATMHASVERMGEAAGRGEGEPPTKAPPEGEEEGDEAEVERLLPPLSSG
jgi:hypothetical protein